MFDKIIGLAKEYALSDIHVHSDEPIAIRLHGSIDIPDPAPVPRKEVEAFIKEVLDEDQWKHFQKVRDVDLSIAKDEWRFRANIYYTINGPAFVLRKIETQIPNIDDLGLPGIVVSASHQKNGLVLVTGPTGSGKSTSLAALIDKINRERHENIITIEDPIEFIHQPKSCIVSQREVGKDAQSFASALKASLREDPDVILVGEMRDLETISLALTAAETGHLVFGTLHTNGAPNSINRILDVFPPQQQAQARSQLSQSLRLVVTQTLLPKTDGSGRVAAFEVMVNNKAVANLIRENKVFQIDQAMQTGKTQGMITMEDSLRELESRGLISNEEEAA